MFIDVKFNEKKEEVKNQTEELGAGISSKNPLKEISFIGKLLGVILRNIKDYLAGIFMMPWIWVFSYLFIISVLFWMTKPEHLILIESQLPGNFTIDGLWRNSVIFIILNYTISFLLRETLPRMRIILFSVSLLILCIFAYVVWSILFGIGAISL
jgi:hypothetical protein